LQFANVAVETDMLVLLLVLVSVELNQLMLHFDFDLQFELLSYRASLTVTVVVTVGVSVAIVVTVMSPIFAFQLLSYDCYFFKLKVAIIKIIIKFNFNNNHIFVCKSFTHF